MLLSQCIDRFFSVKKFSQNTEKQYRYRLMALSRYEDEVGEPIYNLTSDQLTDAFRHASNNPVVWKSLKNLVKSYFYWLKEQDVDIENGLYSLENMSGKELAQNITKQFFYSTGQILAKLEMDIDYVSKADNRYTDDYCMIECAVLLSWFGLKPKEIAEFKKCDISLRRSAIKIHGMWLIIPQEAIEKLNDCSIEIGYTKNNGTTSMFLNYEESDYLFRTHNSDRMNLSTINGILSKFNQKLDPESLPYVFGKIYWSGVFFRARLEERRIGGVPDFKSNEERREFYSRLFHEEISDISTLSNRVEEYNLYKSVF